MIRKTLQDYYIELEGKVEPLEEFILSKKIDDILNIKIEKVTDNDEFAEYIAFKFIVDYSNKETGWGTYYGPMFVLPDEQGRLKEFPSIRQISQAIIDYWKKRAIESKHPVMTYRYADLVFDFEPIISGKKFDFSAAQKVIDSTIKICDLSLDDSLGYKAKLKRALSLAYQINDKTRIQKLKDKIIFIESKYAEDDKPGLWGYAFEWLILDKNRKVTLIDDETQGLLVDLEDRLKRLVGVENPDPWHVECAVRLLAPYYASLNDEHNLMRVLSDLESSFRKNKYANSDGILISNYLEKLVEVYLEYSSFKSGKEARERVINEISNLGDKGKFTMHEISTEIKISNEEIESFVKGIFGVDVNDQLERILGKIAVSFILRKKRVDDQLKDLAKKHPITYLSSHIISSEDGYPIAKFGSISDDYDRHLLENFSRNLHFQAIFLRIIFTKLHETSTPEQIVETLLLSPVYKKEDKNYIFKLIKSFWEKDYISTCCLSIPLIENAVRTLHRLNNKTYIKMNDDGGYDTQSLNALLEDGLLKAVFQTMGEDIEYYLRVLLTERIGWNLRNNFAHGINIKMFESEDVACRLVHVLICLSLVRTNNSKNNKVNKNV